MELTDEELDLLATAYVRNYALAVPVPQRSVEVSSVAAALVAAGLLKEDYTLGQLLQFGHERTNLVRPTVKGIATLKEMDPVRVINAFVRVDDTGTRVVYSGAGAGMAVFWIFRRLSLEQLPLVLSHEIESLRNAARARMDGFEKDEAGGPE